MTGGHRIAVLGAEAEIIGFALAGALVCPAEDPAGITAAWAELPADVAVVVLTAEAARVLGDATAGRLVTVMPP